MSKVNSKRAKPVQVRVRRAPAWLNEAEIGGADVQVDVHQARRLRIAAAAAEAITLNGLDSTSLKYIARHMGFTTGVIQHYFDNKEQLLEFTKNHYIAKLLDEALQLYREAKGEARLQTLCEAILPLTAERRKIWELLIAFNGEVIGDAAMMKAQSAQYRRSVEIFAEAIAEQRGGEARACWADALGLVSLLEGLSYHLVFSSDGYATAKPLKLVASYIDTMILAPRRATRR